MDAGSSASTAGDLRRARVASSVVFAVHGAVMGTVAARTPWIAQHVGADAGELGVVLLMPGLGALLAIAPARRLLHHVDLRTLLRIAILAWCAALLLPAVPTSVAWLCAALLVYGAVAGLADVAMNAHAVLVEQRYGRSVLSGMHGCWSVGGLAGAAGAAVAARLAPDARPHFAATAAVLMVAGALAGRHLLTHRAVPGPPGPPAVAPPHRGVLAIGLLAFCAVFAEGAGLNWSAVYVHDRLGGSAGVAALTVAVFSVSMAAARFGGDRVVRRTGPAAAARIGGLCATVGTLTVVVTDRVAPAVVGFALVGTGIAVIVPLAFAAAGRVNPDRVAAAGPGGGPARGIAGVAGIVYGAGLITPGIVGGVAGASSLTVSFVLVAVLTAAITVGAGVLRPLPARPRLRPPSR